MAEKRKYNAESRQDQATQTRKRILNTAKDLFSSGGFDQTTINMIASAATVSSPTIYALFKSKEGILRELVQITLFGASYQHLVEQARAQQDPKETLKMAARITRTIYEAQHEEIGFIRGALLVSPALRQLVEDGEKQRYTRQKFVLERLEEAHFLPEGMDLHHARDILWTLTGWDNYRMLVIERNWTADIYEAWLQNLLLNTFIKCH